MLFFFITRISKKKVHVNADNADQTNTVCNEILQRGKVHESKKKKGRKGQEIEGYNKEQNILG